jgi:hypothetical protein
MIGTLPVINGWIVSQSPVVDLASFGSSPRTADGKP